MARLSLGIAAISFLMGCATMYKSLGIATVGDLDLHREALAANGAEIDARAEETKTLKERVQVLETAIADLRGTTEGIAATQAQIPAMLARIDEIQQGLATMKDSVENFARVSQAVEELKVEVSSIPDATLKRLVDILSQAIQASAPVRQ